MPDTASFLKKREYDDHIVNIIENTINEATLHHDIYSMKLSQIESYKDISALKDHDVINLIFLTFDVYVELLSQTPKDKNGWVRDYKQPALYILQCLLTHNMKRNLPYTEDDLAHLLFFSNEALSRNIVWIPQNGILGVIEKKYRDTAIPTQILFHLNECKRLSEINSHTYGDYKKLEKRIQKLLDHNNGATIIADHNWSTLIIDDLNKMPTEENAHWQAVLKHALTAASSKPSQKWLSNMKPLINKIKFESYAYYLGRWFNAITEEKLDNIRSDKDFPLGNPANSAIIKGLLWSALINPREDINRHITNLGLYCYKKIPEWGAVSPGTGNVCIYVLGELPSLQSVNALNEMLKKIKYPSARAMVEKSLNASAKNSGLTREDLDELSVPDFDISPDGILEQQIGETVAVIKIQDTTKVDLLWKKADGHIQKSPPANIQSEFDEEIKALKKQIKEIRTTLETQKWRLERLFHRLEPWLFYDWKQRYLDQPLIVHMIKNLIWVFETDNLKQSAIWYEGTFINYNFESIEIHENASRVTLWHPALASAPEINSWQDFLRQKRIAQPFKQAYREYYKATDQTQMHSTLFASHVLQQQKLHALCRQRGWRYDLQGEFDSPDTASINLGKNDIHAQFSLDREDHPLTDMGVYKFVTSDRLRFFRNNNQIALTEVPPVLLSEVMRDADLFVSVCNIENNLDTHDFTDQIQKYWLHFVPSTKT